MFRSNPFRANGRHRRSVGSLTALGAALGVPSDGERDRTPRHRAAVEVKPDSSPRPQHDTAIAEVMGMTEFASHTAGAMDRILASPTANAALPFPEGSNR